jgi:hypothetical protein
MTTKKFCRWSLSLMAGLVMVGCLASRTLRAADAPDFCRAKSIKAKLAESPCGDEPVHFSDPDRCMSFSLNQASPEIIYAVKKGAVPSKDAWPICAVGSGNTGMMCWTRWDNCYYVQTWEYAKVTMKRCTLLQGANYACDTDALEDCYLRGTRPDLINAPWVPYGDIIYWTEALHNPDCPPVRPEVAPEM